jgi:hypothetical protein
VSGGPVTCRVEGLTNGTKYTFTVTATNAAGSSPASAPTPQIKPVVQPGDGFHPLAPSRIIDSRDGTGGFSGPWSAGTIRSYDIEGHGGVPASGVSAVVMNVTVTGPNQSSFLTVWPAGTTRPTASNLNWVAGQTIPNLVTVPLGPSGDRVSIYNLSGSVNVIADVVGWFDGGSPQGDLYTPLVPARILDSRTGNGGYSTPWGTNTTRSLTVAGRGGVPASGATSVVMNVTVTDTTKASFLTVWPHGQSTPTASNLNWSPGQTIPNLVTVPVGAAGQIDLLNHDGNVDVIADVVGYYSNYGAPFHPLAPSRILDSRVGIGGYSTPWGTGTTRPVSIAGVDGVPAGGVVATVGNVTVADTEKASFLTLWPAGSPQPTASNLNWSPGVVIANLTIIGVGAGNQMNVLNHDGQVDVIEDTVGWYG